jgi:hypothetical protein
MKIYLASRYSRFKEMQQVRADLEKDGHVVTSRWINGGHQISDDGLSAQAKESERIRFAQEDLADLQEATICINFTEEPRSTNSRGGRHVEFGFAFGTCKRCIVVGPRENVFHCLPQVEWYPDYAAFKIRFMVPQNEKVPEHQPTGESEEIKPCGWFKHCGYVRVNKSCKGPTCNIYDPV